MKYLNRQALTKALTSLLGPSGWSCGESYKSLVVDEDIEKPTQKALETRLAIFEHNEPIFEKMTVLESQITTRRLVEAATTPNATVDTEGTTAKEWLENTNNQLSELRKELKKW